MSSFNGILIGDTLHQPPGQLNAPDDLFAPRRWEVLQVLVDGNAFRQLAEQVSRGGHFIGSSSESHVEYALVLALK